MSCMLLPADQHGWLVVMLECCACCLTGQAQSSALIASSIRATQQQLHVHSAINRLCECDLNLTEECTASVRETQTLRAHFVFEVMTRLQSDHCARLMMLRYVSFSWELSSSASLYSAMSSAFMPSSTSACMTHQQVLSQVMSHDDVILGHAWHHLPLFSAGPLPA